MDESAEQWWLFWQIICRKRKCEMKESEAHLNSWNKLNEWWRDAPELNHYVIDLLHVIPACAPPCAHCLTEIWRSGHGGPSVKKSEDMANCSGGSYRFERYVEGSLRVIYDFSNLANLLEKFEWALKVHRGEGGWVCGGVKNSMDRISLLRLFVKSKILTYGIAVTYNGILFRNGTFRLFKKRFLVWCLFS